MLVLHEEPETELLHSEDKKFRGWKMFGKQKTKEPGLLNKKLQGPW